MWFCGELKDLVESPTDCERKYRLRRALRQAHASNWANPPPLPPPRLSFLFFMIPPLLLCSVVLYDPLTLFLSKSCCHGAWFNSSVSDKRVYLNRLPLNNFDYCMHINTIKSATDGKGYGILGPSMGYAKFPVIYMLLSAPVAMALITFYWARF